ncbi:MAG: BamA/TamA family outer membrane protein [Paludibacter sp.]|nr:BamA/TamA family outer membrane protein [Paludibacter sp.]
MKWRFIYPLFSFILLFTACNTTKYVPDGEYLLNKVSIKTDTKNINKDELTDYYRQTPNAAVFGVFKMQLGIYNWAGNDTTKWTNRMLKRIGDPPVLYNSSLTSLTVQQLQRVLENKGYIHAKVESNLTTKGKKANVEYIVNSNKPYILRNYTVNVKNKMLNETALDTSRTLIRPNMLFDVDILNAERERIASRLRQIGYYNFNKEFLIYTADSTLKSNQVDITLEVQDYLKRSDDSISNIIFKKYSIRKVTFYSNTDANIVNDVSNIGKMDTVQFRNFILISPKDQTIKLDALVQNTFINPENIYSDRSVERTYSALNSLGPIKYVNISFKETSDTLLDCNILIVPSKTISVSTELEGTYTGGYWGVAGNINYIDRNRFKGAETLSVLGRIAFEWQKGIWAQEWGAQVGLKFPRFMLPIGNYDFKRNIHANTEFTTAFSYQLRPAEFSTISVGAGVKYSWNRRQFQHSFQLFDLNYIYFPVIEPAFRDSFLNPVQPKFNPYNYENHFIMRTGYAGSYTNFSANRPLRNFSTMRYNIETAGNLLYGLNHLLGSVPSSVDGSFRLFNIRYSQYVKGEYNITHHQIYNAENRFVYHLGIGVGVPYGNANSIPYEKRFYSGGANSVRGWSESTLGPGGYKNTTGINYKSRDYNQVGDIKLDMNLEYRAKMFWLMEGALFLDAGNIWTIQDYDTQKNGTFRFDTFMKQIAIAYGFGIRFDFSFFIARVDVGVKLFDPVLTRREQWRVNPNFNDDFALHFAIGYPF